MDQDGIISGPRFNVVAGNAFRLRPFNGNGLSNSIYRGIVSFYLIHRRVRHASQVTSASVPLHFLSKATPIAIFVLRQLNKRYFRHVSSTVASSFFRIHARYRVDDRLRPFVGLNVAVYLGIRAAMVGTFRSAKLIRRAAKCVMVYLFHAAKVTGQVTLFRSHA